MNRNDYKWTLRETKRDYYKQKDVKYEETPMRKIVYYGKSVAVDFLITITKYLSNYTRFRLHRFFIRIA